jgi:hypothetical protein
MSKLFQGKFEISFHEKKIKCFSSTRIPFSSEPTLWVKHREYYRILINEPLFFYRQDHLWQRLQVGWFKSNRNRFRPILPKPFMAILVFNVFI